MTEVLSVKYEETGKVVYVLPNQNYQVGDYLVIKNKKGCRLAQAVTANEEMDDVKLPAEMDKVLRPANEKDFQAYQENLELAMNSFDKVNELTKANQLKMKVIDIVFPLHFVQKIVWTFVSFYVIWLLTLKHVLNFVRLIVVKKLKCTVVWGLVAVPFAVLAFWESFHQYQSKWSKIKACHLARVKQQVSAVV